MISMNLMHLMKMETMKEELILHLQNAYFNPMFIILLIVSSTMEWHN